MKLLSVVECTFTMFDSERVDLFLFGLVAINIIIRNFFLMKLTILLGCNKIAQSPFNQVTDVYDF